MIWISRQAAARTRGGQKGELCELNFDLPSFIVLLSKLEFPALELAGVRNVGK